MPVDNDLISRLREMTAGYNDVNQNELPAGIPQEEINRMLNEGTYIPEPPKENLDSIKQKNEEVRAKLSTLKLQREASKMYNTSQGDPTIQSAAQELIQKLRTPRERQIDFSPLYALASPGVRDALLKTHKPVESQEDRLMKATQIELAQAKLKNALQNVQLKQQEKVRFYKDKQEDKERQEIRTKLIPTISGTLRSPLVRDQEKALEVINYMENQIRAAQEDVSPIVEADKYNLSTGWSRVISNSAPTQTLIEKSIYRSAKGAFEDAKEWVYGSRAQSTYTKEDLKQMADQLKILKASKLQARSTVVSRSIRGYSGLLKKYPDIIDGIQAEYGDLVDIDQEGIPKRKQFNPYTGDVVVPGEAPGSSDSVKNFLKLMGK